MITHQSLGNTAFARSRALKQMIDDGRIRFGGNRSLHIYGKLDCSSGKRMKVKNRVFFHSEAEAVTQGYRPCGHCMQQAYRQWKSDQDKLRQS